MKCVKINVKLYVVVIFFSANEVFKMKLQTKAVLLLNVFVIVACLCMDFLGYYSADQSFAVSLQRKVSSNVKSIIEIMENKYPGDWHIENGLLYKGNEKIDKNEQLVDFLGELCDGHVTIFQNDTRIATTVKKSDGQRSVGTKASETVINEVLKNGKHYIGLAKVLDEDYHSAYAPLKDGTDTIVGMAFVGVPARSVDGVRSVVLSIIVTIFIIVTVLGIISWFLIGREMNKLTVASNAVSEIAEGDLRIADLPITAEDEIGTLSQSVNNMKKNLRKLITNVSNASERVAASSEELTASAYQVTETIQHSASNAVEMTEDAAKQADTINNLQSIINDMSNKMQELQKSAVAMNEVASASQERAVDGKQKVDYAIEQIKNIAEQVNKSSEVVINLGKRSDEIGKIVDTISAIADQTNLLALNAAIEAARAGAQGRGFAVVAEEVRKLAEQSNSAAKNISELINTIQQETNSAVEAINQGNASVHEGSKSVMATGEAFTGIEQQVDKLNANVQNSIQHIDSVNSTQHHILDAVEVVHNISQKSTEKAQNVSAVTQEQAATLHEMSDASSKLAELAQQLQNEVLKFKI